MSFDEYVNHISQKYRIAIAISVIKTKPKDLSIDEYLTQLQRKIKDMEFDPNETVCSDDFKFDDDELADQNNLETPINSNNGNEFDFKSNKPVINYSVKDFQSSQKSQTILNNYVFGDDGIHDEKLHKDNLENGLENPLNLYKAATDLRNAQEHYEQTPQHHQNLSQLTYCESQELNINGYNNATITCYNIANPKPNNALQNNDTNLTNLDSQETELYSLEAFTQNYTHVSQTQDEQFIISNKFIRSKVDNKHMAELTQGNSVVVDSGVENTKIRKEITENKEHGYKFPTEYGCSKNVAPNKYIAPNCNALSLTKDRAREHDHNDNMETQYDYDKINILNEYEPVHNKTAAHNNFAINTVNVIDYKANNESHINIEQTQLRGLNEDENTELFDNGSENFAKNNEMEVDDKTDSDDNSQAVKVPFKVLEELHRVKAFLSKKDRRYTDGYSTDSGYRSDSQVRSSFKNSSQSTMIWVNQSAHCLFTYIIQAPVAVGDIVSDISQVLGQLIDKLHDEENYPPFLEELLETADTLIREAYEGDNWAEDALLTKDETTHRLLLLNKSKHILKHSIEIITNLLEKLHTNLTQENQYELTNINEIENASYIFHILEIFLKKYLKLKNSSQVSQNSQDRLPKRSSLTELWRKKWNPNYKEISLHQENVTVCIVKKCSEILNKIIVECMDGYSLLSFAALQCFNVIQS
ncbi:uncharacterized protein [Choristoneura fumiferana]|uniref:uncharacterized protein n=1 Tax=Choristoneura fumiferana TaxID=7141 RepID=UPI003D15DE75